MSFIKEKHKYLNMNLTEKRKEYCCKSSYVTVNDIPTWNEYSRYIKTTQPYEASEYMKDESLNDKVSIFVGDITVLEVDAIVNSSKKTLLCNTVKKGDPSETTKMINEDIHRAAGSSLFAECISLNSCEQGEAKITGGYKLPAKRTYEVTRFNLIKYLSSVFYFLSRCGDILMLLKSNPYLQICHDSKDEFEKRILFQIDELYLLFIVFRWKGLRSQLSRLFYGDVCCILFIVKVVNRNRISQVWLVWTRYPGRRCWVILVPTNSYIHLWISKMESEITCESYLEVNDYRMSERINKFCSSDRYKNPITAFSNVTVTHEIKPKVGVFTTFTLKYIIKNLECLNTKSFECDENSCVSEEKVCDGVKDCKNGVDEIGCETGVMTIKEVPEVIKNSVSWMKRKRAEELMAKEIEFSLAISLLKPSLTNSELSMFINALLVTCHNPRQFYGIDMVKRLKDQMEESGIFTHPLAYLTLCNANESWPLRANSDLDSILSSSSDGEEHSRDWNLNATIKYLMKKLNSSSVDFLATYLILPILNSKSLIDISYVNCSANPRKHGEDPFSEIADYLVPKQRVLYSLYIGDEKPVTYSIPLNVPKNSTAFEVMEVAEAEDKKYKFEWKMTSGKLYVYEIAGIKNDPEAGKFWMLYKDFAVGSESLTHLTKGPNEIIIGDMEHLVWWYKTATF
ncbi:ADP-ribose glycohydrolase MACROD1 like protein [Argiope bruennichi]|uniref:ADP-ribose glycohydrolase MACROD1 like protein n=1 Tax=Argiope bruennichi TaxID=94029 RepID=A0A8T0E2G0_ARGBR|nr:ADP-ribose glycohydrolase MACROD1 like protein [Argiope bruennichi]